MAGSKKLSLYALVALAVLAGAFAYQHFTKIREQTETTKLLNAGRSIYLALFDRGMVDAGESIVQEHFAQASSAVYSNSTDYFRDMVTSGFLNVNVAFFSGKGVPASTTPDPSGFSAENNAWCVVADINSITDGNTPIMFTRNVAIEMMGASQQPILTTNAPFGTSGFVYITKRGSATFAKGDEIQNWFTGRTGNKVLRP